MNNTLKYEDIEPLTLKKILYSFVILSTALIFVSCIQNRPERDCLISELVLDESDYPDGFVVDEISSPIADYPLESAGLTASFNQDLIFHVVGRYKSRKGAEQEYNNVLSSSFVEDKYRGPWIVPNEISYVSPVAQKYHLACGNVLGEYQCRMIGQYEEYYVFFFAYISEDGITFDILGDLLKKIDHHMAQCLQAGD
ncbi:MAG: hypothetical protein JRJ00_03285 [Deltaproteobacteria bacterium]|nr:hypothetical protein [Deltaproteobacteria bacterium]